MSHRNRETDIFEKSQIVRIQENTKRVIHKKLSMKNFIVPILLLHIFKKIKWGRGEVGGGAKNTN